MSSAFLNRPIRSRINSLQRWPIVFFRIGITILLTLYLFFITRARERSLLAPENNERNCFFRASIQFARKSMYRRAKSEKRERNYIHIYTFSHYSVIERVRSRSARALWLVQTCSRHYNDIIRKSLVVLCLCLNIIHL